MTNSSLPSSFSEEHLLGHRNYDKHSHAQGDVSRFGLDLIADAVNAIHPAQAARAFRIVDYGCAQGNLSLRPIRTALEQVKARWTPMPGVSVIHTDLPTNDWTTFFQTVLTSPDSYTAGETRVFGFASATSIHEQLCPPGIIDLGYSALTVQWLSRKPASIPGHIWPSRATGAAREAWAAQARADWRSFLHNRAVELTPTGQLVVIGSGADAQGQSGAEPLLDLANHALQSMVEGGHLTQQEYAAMGIPTYSRTEHEWREPFADTAFLQTTPMALDHYQEALLPDLLLEQYEQTRDAAAFARAYAALFNTAYGPSLWVSLRADRTPQDKGAIADLFLKQLQSAIAQDPPAYACRWILALLRITRLEAVRH